MLSEPNQCFSRVTHNQNNFFFFFVLIRWGYHPCSFFNLWKVLSILYWEPTSQLMWIRQLVGVESRPSGQPVELIWCCPSVKRPLSTHRPCWRDYISQMAQEHFGFPQERQEDYYYYYLIWNNTSRQLRLCHSQFKHSPDWECRILTEQQFSFFTCILQSDFQVIFQ